MGRGESARAWLGEAKLGIWPQDGGNLTLGMPWLFYESVVGVETVESDSDS